MMDHYRWYYDTALVAFWLDFDNRVPSRVSSEDLVPHASPHTI